MKTKLVRISLLMVMALCLPIMAQAVPPAPHDSSNGYMCNSCHASHNTLGALGFRNVCITCHTLSDPKAKRFPFSQKDGAAPAGISLTVYSSGTVPTQTSHSFSGKYNNPAAGAQSPTAPGMGTRYGGDALVCSSCHNIHNARSSSINSAPFLKIRNDNDEMCRNCHVVRDQDSHMGGTHPINVNYTSIARRNPTKFNFTPTNQYASNPTSQMKLKNGKVQCSSCHGLHYTNSRGGQFHNNSAARGFLPMSASTNGKLLRTDARGNTAADINICSNCHISKHNHNGKNQNVQCNDCHSGHVEYDPQDDPMAPSDKNVYLVRRYMAYSSPLGKNRRVFFTKTGAQTREYGNATTNPSSSYPQGVCTACHVVPAPGLPIPGKSFPYPPEHNMERADLCGSCHSHSTTEGSFAGDCNSCHGIPPKINSAGPDGFVKNYTTIKPRVNEAMSPHQGHAAGPSAGNHRFNCIECHKGNTHNDPLSPNTLRDVFLSPATTISVSKGGTPVFTPGAGATWSKCTTVYCHSNGRANGSGAVYAPAIDWGNNKDTIIGQPGECVACHNLTNTALGTATDSHWKHITTTAGNQMGYSCNVCHKSTIDTTIVGSTPPFYSLFSTARNMSGKHVNGTADVVFGTALTTGGIYASPNCTVYCHSDGKGNYSGAKWDTSSTGACGTCHGTADPAHKITTGGHDTHLFKQYGPSDTPVNSWTYADAAPEACKQCHTYTALKDAPHINGSYNNFVAGACDTCHPTAAGTTNVGQPWAGGRLACNLCHGIGVTTNSLVTIGTPLRAPYKGMTTFRGKGHGLYSSARITGFTQFTSAALFKQTLLRNPCAKCHDPNSKHLEIKATTRMFAPYTSVKQNSLCAGCHFQPKVPAWSQMRQFSSSHVTKYSSDSTQGKGDMLCSVCHDVHGSKNNVHMVNSFINFSGGFRNMTATITYSGQADLVKANNRGVCQNCHSKTKYYKRNVTQDTNLHFASNCVSCHMHKGTYAFRPRACNECHGYPPAPKSFMDAGLAKLNNWSTATMENYSGGGGAHVVAGHIAKTVKPGDGFAPCMSCHADGASAHVTDMNTWPPLGSANTTLQRKVNTSVKIDTGLKFNDSKQIEYRRKTGDTPANSGTCWNASCHFQPTPRWSTDK